MSAGVARVASSKPLCSAPLAVEWVDTLSEYPQLIERVRVIEFCRGTGGWDWLQERIALRYDGRITRDSVMSDIERLWERRTPNAPVRDRAEILRERRR